MPPPPSSSPFLCCLPPLHLLLPSLPSLTTLPLLAPPPRATSHRTRLLLHLPPSLYNSLLALAARHHAGSLSAALRAALDAAIARRVAPRHAAACACAPFGVDSAAASAAAAAAAAAATASGVSIGVGDREGEVRKGGHRRVASEAMSDVTEASEEEARTVAVSVCVGVRHVAWMSEAGFSVTAAGGKGDGAGGNGGTKCSCGMADVVVAVLEELARRQVVEMTAAAAAGEDIGAAFGMLVEDEREL